MARILVIDDDEILNMMMMQLLAEAGYEVVGVPDGGIGYRLFECQSFDLIVTDIVMPDTEGIEMIQAIRKKNKAIPIIAISGGGRLDPAQYLVIAKQCGANDVFPKPFVNRIFLETIRKYLP